MKKRITFGLIIVMVIMSVMGCSGDSKKTEIGATPKLTGKSKTDTKEEVTKDEVTEEAKEDERETSGGSGNSFFEQQGLKITHTGRMNVVSYAYNVDYETNTISEGRDFTSDSTIAMCEYEDEEDSAYKYIDFSIEMDLSDWDENYEMFTVCTGFMDRDTGYTLNYYGEYNQLKKYTLATAKGDIEVELIGSGSMLEDGVTARFAYSLHCPSDYDGFVAGVYHTNIVEGCSVLDKGNHVPSFLATDDEAYAYSIKNGYTPMYFSASEK